MHQEVALDCPGCRLPKGDSLVHILSCLQLEAVILGPCLRRFDLKPDAVFSEFLVVSGSIHEANAAWLACACSAYHVGNHERLVILASAAAVA